MPSVEDGAISRVCRLRHALDGRRRDHGRLPRVVLSIALPLRWQSRLPGSVGARACLGPTLGLRRRGGHAALRCLRRPGLSSRKIQADAWNPAARALVDRTADGIGRARSRPTSRSYKASTGGLVAALEAEGVEVPRRPHRTASRRRFTRDPLISVPGGVIVGRLAPLMRRGEELSVTRAVGALGIPILRTITGTGLLEGGSFAKLTPRVAAFVPRSAVTRRRIPARRDAQVARDRIDRRPSQRLLDPPDRPFRHGGRRQGARRSQRLPHGSSTSSRAWDRGDLVPSRGGVGDQLARRAPRSHPHVRGLPAHRQAPGTAGGRGRGAPVRRNSEERWGGSTAPRWSSGTTPPDEPRQCFRSCARSTIV